MPSTELRHGPCCTDSGPADREEFLDDYGLEHLDDLAQSILTRLEQLIRTRIAALPVGCYRHELEIDGYLERVWLPLRSPWKAVKSR